MFFCSRLKKDFIAALSPHDGLVPACEMSRTTNHSEKRCVHSLAGFISVPSSDRV